MSTEDDTDELEHGIDVALSERELLSIGKIIALWGTLEYEIFCQTLMCFDTSNGVLPKEMNKTQFFEVLTLWEALVVNKAEGKRKEVLQQQNNKIRQYYDFRNALAHGMWDWSRAGPEKITAILIRTRKKEVLRTDFTAEDLELFVSELQRINFKVRYPGGGDDYTKALAKQGSSISRLGFCLMTSNPLTVELLPSSVRRALAAYLLAQDAKG